MINSNAARLKYGEFDSLIQHEQSQGNYPAANDLHSMKTMAIAAINRKEKDAPKKAKPRWS